MLLRESLFGGSRQSSKYLVRINKSVINIYFGRLIIALPRNTMNLSSPGARALCKDKVLPRPERRRVQQQKRRQLGPWGGTAHTHTCPLTLTLLLLPPSTMEMGAMGGPYSVLPHTKTRQRLDCNSYSPPCPKSCSGIRVCPLRLAVSSHRAHTYGLLRGFPN